MKRNLVALFSVALLTLGFNSFAGTAQTKVAVKDATKTEAPVDETATTATTTTTTPAKAKKAKKHHASAKHKQAKSSNSQKL